MCLSLFLLRGHYASHKMSLEIRRLFNILRTFSVETSKANRFFVTSPTVIDGFLNYVLKY